MAASDDWGAHVAMTWSDETAAVDEVVRVFPHRDPSTNQPLVSHDHALVASPYVS